MYRKENFSHITITLWSGGLAEQNKGGGKWRIQRKQFVMKRLCNQKINERMIAFLKKPFDTLQESTL